MTRDDFRQKVKNDIAKHVNYRCSNPNCRVPTVSKTKHGGTSSIGEVAHICAASPGGPRYDSSMTSEERKSIENALWLCSNCATEIDRDEQRYTVSILKQWKRQAEDSARSEKGRPLPSSDETINTLTTAFTGNHNDLPARAVHNIHAAVENTYEKLDSRFSVSSSRVDESIHFNILAKEEVSVEFRISGASKDEFISQYQSFFDHGNDIEVESSDIRVIGSKLFEEIYSGREGRFSISNNPISAKQKLWLVSPDESRTEVFDDIDGSLVIGNVSSTFSGSNCGGLFSFKYTVSRGSNSNAPFTMNLKFEQWDGKAVSNLPYFEKIFNFYKCLSDGWALFTCMEVNGIRVFQSEGSQMATSLEIKNFTNFLQYTRRAQVVADALKKNLLFKSTIPFDQKSHCDLADAADLFCSSIVSHDKSSRFSCKITTDKNGENIFDLLESDPQLNALRLTEDSTLDVFGQEIELPTKVIELKNVQAKLRGKPKDVQEGKEVTIDWLPVEGFKMVTYFVTQTYVKK